MAESRARKAGLGPRARRTWIWPLAATAVMLGLWVFTLASSAAHARVSGSRTTTASASAAREACRLGHGVKHVIDLTFDNVHFFRDNPNVPSDLELMPNLLNFFEQNGTMMSNNHTPLIAHTADDILTTLTGLYGDRHGMPISTAIEPTTRTERPTRPVRLRTGRTRFSTPQAFPPPAMTRIRRWSIRRLRRQPHIRLRSPIRRPRLRGCRSHEPGATSAA